MVKFIIGDNRTDVKIVKHLQTYTPSFRLGVTPHDGGYRGIVTALNEYRISHPDDGFVVISTATFFNYATGTIQEGVVCGESDHDKFWFAIPRVKLYVYHSDAV